MRPGATQGDPVSLDSKDSRYGGYREQVRKLIKDKLSYPCLNNEATGLCDYKPARLVVEFGLLADGRVAYVKVTKKAEWPIYNDYAVNAVRLAAPFPPVPPDLMAQAKPGREDVRISAAFNYSSHRSRTNPRLTQRASVLIALSPLTSAATAYAECAWVL
jgi:outer membrane biosynthesis protein TonB